VSTRDAGGLEEFLRGEGASDRVVQGGLDVLLAGWERTVGSVESGYSAGYEDYLNDLDGRQLLAQALERVTADQAAVVASRLAALDDRMRAATTPVARCLWGLIVAEEERWNLEANWWYYARPRAGLPEFLGEFPAA